jgi:DMSO/TMAO reductase YedYZ molybdopterin-dependent catalytic subunit
VLTPNHRFYVRSNFPLPARFPGLSVGGLVERPLEAVDLAGFEHRRVVATVECAGNGRAFLQPPVPGEQWELGAVSTAEWSGVQLCAVLEEARVRPEAVEILFEAADGFARSLPFEVALAPDTLLVTVMNGEPLPLLHGGPVRVLVPGWYGMAAVKWLSRIEAVGEPFRGHYQAERYVVEGRPVREMAVRAIISDARPGSVRGYAWTGRGTISSVELNVDGGQTVGPARLLPPAGPYAWVEWVADWQPARPGEHVLVARATDSEGRVQPLEQSWNELGYANNQARPVTVVS